MTKENFKKAIEIIVENQNDCAKNIFAVDGSHDIVLTYCNHRTMATLIQNGFTLSLSSYGLYVFSLNSIEPQKI